MLYIYQDGAIFLSFTQGKIIYSKHVRSRSLRQLGCTNQSQKRIGTDGHSQNACQACASFPSEHETKRLQLRGTAFRSSGIGFDLLPKPFGKSTSRTYDVGADEAAHAQFYPHGQISPAEIADDARVITMNLP